MLVTMGDDVTKTIVQNLTPSTTGRVLHSAALYDLLLWLVTLMPSTDHLVEPPFQLPASEGPAGSELDMALCRLGWLHTPQVSPELPEA
jgi:hypothetical protein